MSVSPITCHILDTSKGKPASGVTCQLFYLTSSIESKNDVSAYELDQKIAPFAMSKTDQDGRIKNWIINPSLNGDTRAFLGINSESGWNALKPGIYKIKFLTGKYFFETKDSNNRTFFPFVDITFEVDSPPDNHYHIPLLLSNHSYTTYRGS